MPWPDLTDDGAITDGTSTTTQHAREHEETFDNLDAVRDVIASDPDDLLAAIAPDTDLTGWAGTVNTHLDALDTDTAAIAADVAAIVVPTSLSDLSAPTGNLSIGSHKLTNVTDPTSAQDAATKAYADGIASGLAIKTAVRLATAAALPANTYNNGASGVGATLTATGNGALSVDGSVVVAADRILVKNEVAPANNGIYTVTTVGTGATPYVLTRATDADASSELLGAFTFVTAGTVNTSAGFVVVGAGPWTVGTTAINWTQFSGGGAYIGGDGLALTGSTFSVNVDTTTIAITADTLGAVDGTGGIWHVQGLSTTSSAGVATANTTAFNSTITAAAILGGSVRFPGGQYEVNGTVLLKSLVILEGATMESSIIYQRNGSNLDAVVATDQWYNNSGGSAATSQRSCGLRNLTIDYNWKDKNAANTRNTSANHGHCYAGATYRGRFENVRCIRAYGHGFYMDTVSKDGSTADGQDSLQNVFTYCTTEYTGLCGIHLDDNVAGSGNMVDGKIDFPVIVSPNQRNINNTDGGTTFTHNDRYGHGIFLQNATGWVVADPHIYGAYTAPAAWSNFAGNRVKHGVWARNANGCKIYGNQIADFGYAGTAAEYAGIRMSMLDWRNNIIGPIDIWTKEWNTNGDGTGSSTYVGVRVSSAIAGSCFTSIGVGITSESLNSNGPGTASGLTLFSASVSGAGTITGTVSGWNARSYSVAVNGGSTAALQSIRFDANNFQYLTAAPATGRHPVGYKVWKSDVAAAGSPGWVCTTAGAPGTFKAMAVVAA